MSPTWPASKVSQAGAGGRLGQWLERRAGEQQEGAMADGGRTGRGARNPRSDILFIWECVRFKIRKGLNNFVTWVIFATLFIELRKSLLAVSAT